MWPLLAECTGIATCENSHKLNHIILTVGSADFDEMVPPLTKPATTIAEITL